jgi:hypothetical protein
VNDILEHKKNADRKQCISDRVAPLSKGYWDTMTVKDMLAIAQLNKAVGMEYFVKLLGVKDGNAEMINATRLKGISHQCNIDMKPNRRQVCNAVVAEWRARTEKSPANTPPQSKNCKCHVCLLYLEANPPQPPKPRAKAKPTPSKQQPSKQQSPKQQSWGHSPGSNSKKKGKGKRSRIGSASGCAGKLGIDCEAAKQMLENAGGGDKLHMSG